MRFWTISSVDTAAPGVTDWYADTALPRLAAMPGVTRAWLLETTTQADDHGPSLPQLLAVYEAADVLDVGDDWAGAPGEVTGARAAAREVLVDLWIPTPTPGAWFASVRIDPAYDIAAEDARTRWADFERWYTFEHVGETVVAPGFHEGWRLGPEQGTTGPTTFHDHERWAMYELTNAEDMMIHVNKAPLRPIWNDNVDAATFGRSYHRVVGRA